LKSRSTEESNSVNDARMSKTEEGEEEEKKQGQNIGESRMEAMG